MDGLGEQVLMQELGDLRLLALEQFVEYLQELVVLLLGLWVLGVDQLDLVYVLRQEHGDDLGGSRVVLLHGEFVQELGQGNEHGLPENIVEVGHVQLQQLEDELLVLEGLVEVRVLDEEAQQLIGSQDIELV